MNLRKIEDIRFKKKINLATLKYYLKLKLCAHFFSRVQTLKNNAQIYKNKKKKIHRRMERAERRKEKKKIV